MSLFETSRNPYGLGGSPFGPTGTGSSLYERTRPTYPTYDPTGYVPGAPDPTDPGTYEPYPPGYIPLEDNPGQTPVGTPGDDDYLPPYVTGGSSLGQIIDSARAAEARGRQYLARIQHDRDMYLRRFSNQQRLQAERAFANTIIQGLGRDILTQPYHTLSGTRTDPQWWPQPEMEVYYGYLLSLSVAQAADTAKENVITNPEYREAMFRAIGAAWAAMHASRMTGTLYSALAPIKWLSTWQNPLVGLTSIMTPAIVMLAGLQTFGVVSKLVNFSNGIAELTPPEEIAHDPVDDSQPVPVAITTPTDTITVTKPKAKKKTTRIQVTPLNNVLGAKAMPLKVTGSAIRQYPMAVTSVATDIPAVIHTPISLEDAPAIPNTKLQVQVVNGTLVLTRVIDLATTVKPNRLDKGKKSAWSLEYLAMTRVASWSVGTVSEVLEMYQAVLSNTRVRVGGLWWTLGALDGQQRAKVLKGMESGQYKYVVDWLGIGKTLLANEIIDRAVGEAKKLETQAWANMVGPNTFGTGVTWINRGK